VDLRLRQAFLEAGATSVFAKENAAKLRQYLGELTGRSLTVGNRPKNDCSGWRAPCDRAVLVMLLGRSGL
jgi:hypothetical protein